MDFGVFDLSYYASIMGVRKREGKSGYDRENFLSRASLSSGVILCLSQTALLAQETMVSRGVYSIPKVSATASYVVFPR